MGVTKGLILFYLYFAIVAGEESINKDDNTPIDGEFAHTLYLALLFSLENMSKLVIFIIF